MDDRGKHADKQTRGARREGREKRQGETRGQTEGSRIPGSPFIHSTHLAVAGDNTNRIG